MGRVLLVSRLVGRELLYRSVLIPAVLATLVAGTALTAIPGVPGPAVR
jgi:hypothetical protein